jgi:hypothetical protein
MAKRHRRCTQEFWDKAVGLAEIGDERDTRLPSS